MREVKLPSGAVLEVSPSPFAVSKALYQALLKEARGLNISTKAELQSVYKEIFCAGFSSPEIEECLWECFSRCIYRDKRGALKIDADTFEPVEARDDYMKVCLEVAKENVLPFAKSLYAEYLQMLGTIDKGQA